MCPSAKGGTRGTSREPIRDRTYTNGGAIDVRVNPVVVDGVPVPSSEDAEIKLPAYHVVAHATFSDYSIVRDSSAGSVSAR